MTSDFFLFVLPVTLLVTFVAAVSYTIMASILGKQIIPIKTKNVAYFFSVSAASSTYFALNPEGITQRFPYDTVGTILLMHAIAFLFSFSWAHGVARFFWSIPFSLLGGAIVAGTTLTSTLFLALFYMIIGLKSVS